MVKREYLINQKTINMLISIITSLDLTDELKACYTCTTSVDFILIYNYFLPFWHTPT